jgi:hypothetical protein
VHGYTYKGAGKKGFPTYIPVGQAFLEAPSQQNLFLVVVGVPAPGSDVDVRYFVLSHEDALQEWRTSSDTTSDGQPYDQGPLYWGLYLKNNIERYESKWEKLPT